MNLMGKIFTLLIFFLSITFLVLAVMVGASHRNWKEIAIENKEKSTLLEARIETGRAEKTQGVREKNAEQVSRQQQLSQLFSQLEIEEKRTKKEELAFRQKSEENAQLLSQIAVANQRLQDQDAEVMQLKASNKNLLEDVATQRKSVVSLTTQIFELRGQVQALDQNNQNLSSVVAQQTRVMKAIGVSITDATDQIPKPLEGIVTKRTDDFIAVSLGTDDGLRVGHSLDVYRSDRFVGRATVTRAEHDISAARLLPEYEQTLVREGDYVTTKF